jgi:hypothetical protein
VPRQRTKSSDASSPSDAPLRELFGVRETSVRKLYCLDAWRKLLSVINNQVPLHLSYGIPLTSVPSKVFVCTYHFPYIVELRSDPTLVGCNIFRIARVFFPVWRLVRSNQDGERAEPLAKMLLGAKHAGRPPTVSRIIVKE